MKNTDIFEHIYQNIDGFSLSDIAQKSHPYYSVGMTYGEASLKSFLQILSFANPQPGETFYDLGAGVGKKVIAAAHSYPFLKCVGIELLPALHAASQHALTTYQRMVGNPVTSIHFLCKDFNTQDFSDGDIFFLSLTGVAMEIELYGRLASKLNTLKKGARLITTDIPFLSESYAVQEYNNLRPFRNKGSYFLHTKIL